MKQKKWLWMLAAAGMLLVASWLRLKAVHQHPPGLYFDEAVNLILTNEIAFAGARPFPFYAPFTGKEIFYFYHAALMMQGLGGSLFAMHYTSMISNLIAIAATVALGRAMFGGRRGWVLGMLAGICFTVSFPQIYLSRQAFRAVSLPMLQALSLWALFVGVRAKGRRRWAWLAAAGVFGGLNIYTYISSRLYPIWLGVVFFVLWAGDRAHRKTRFVQGALVMAVLVLVASPMIIDYLQHSEVYMERISHLTPDRDRDVPTYGESIVLHARMFFIAGDPYFRYNETGAPYFSPLVGGLFAVGLVISLWRMVGAKAPVVRAAYVLLACSPLMVIPSVLAVAGEPPSHMRSVGMVPVVFLLPAVGAVYLWEQVTPYLPRKLAWIRRLPAALAGGGLLVLALTVWGRYARWAADPVLYYESHGHLEAAGYWLNDAAQPDETVYIASGYQNPTLSATAREYGRLRWIWSDFLVLPPVDQPALYVIPHWDSRPPALWGDIFTEAHALDGLPLGPDGGPAFHAYRFAASELPRPEPEIALDAHFGGVVALRGADVHLPPPVSKPGEKRAAYARALLHWEVLSQPAQNWQIKYELIDAQGLPWGESGSFIGDARRLQPGEWLVTQAYVLPRAGAPPLENYALHVSWYDAETHALLPMVDDAGYYRGAVAEVPEVKVNRGDPGTVKLPPLQGERVEFANGLSLLGWHRESDAVQRPGDPIFLSLYWQTTAPAPEGVTLAVRLVPDAGSARVLWEGEPVHGVYPPSMWSEGEVVLDRYGRFLPVDLASGAYRLALEMDGEEVGLGAVEIMDVSRVFEVPPVAERADARFGEHIRLVGFEVSAREVAPGETLAVDLVWQCLQPVSESYTVFVHLLNPADDMIRAQRDTVPLDGAYPTSLWAQGEVVQDRYMLTVNPETQPGDYLLVAGLYLPESGLRLPVAGEDRASLGTVRVTE